MNISYRWLQQLLPGYTGSVAHTADWLAMYGAPVEEIRDVGAALRDIVIGRVMTAERHPNADRLSLCTVDAGGEQLSVVCGAPNVVAGACYPFAPVGAVLPGGMTIRKAKIRGETSHGMLCSARELGLGREHEGILALAADHTPGESFVGALDLDDVIFTIDVTPNRPDLLSHLGVARELAAPAGARPTLPAIRGAGGEIALALQTAPRSIAVDGVRVSVEDTAACPRYLGAVVRGVTIGPSPDWLALRLRALGLRPVNNVVDATNHVLHELGQPLHAFDLGRVGDTVVVRMARAGERIVTLDDVERELEPDMLVIADADRPIALAGVMGGAATEVSDTTRDLFIECALFNPATVRHTRRAVGLTTDASQRFERGVDPDGVERALRRCVELIVAVAGGEPGRTAHAVGPALPAKRRIRLRPERVAQVLGVAMPIDQIAALLGGIGFPAERAGDALNVTVPGFRSYDIVREADLIEEVARRHGYDAFPDELRAFRPGTVAPHPLEAIEARLRVALVAHGLLEARNSPFAPTDAGEVELLRPLSTAEGRLRNTLLRGLLQRVAYNFAHGTRDIRLFEIGTTFHRGEGELPVEMTRLAVVLAGARLPPHWSGDAGDFEIWDLIGLAERIGALIDMRIEPLDSVAPAAAAAAAVDAAVSGHDPAAAALAVLEPAAAFRFIAAPGASGGAAAPSVLGIGGVVLARSVDSPRWAPPILGFELVLPRAQRPAITPRYRPIATYPSVERDLALLVPATLPAGVVRADIRATAGDLLADVGIFDVFRGGEIPAGLRSIGYRLRFSSAERTLTDAEVDALVQRVLDRLKEAHGVERR